METTSRLFIATNFYGPKNDAPTAGVPKRAGRAAQRHSAESAAAPPPTWRFEEPIATISERRRLLRVETKAPALVHWTYNRWRTTRDDPTWEVRSGIHVVDLSIPTPLEAREINFTFYWPAAGRWEGRDFTVVLEETPKRPSRSGARDGSDE
jgi:glucoamylase